MPRQKPRTSAETSRLSRLSLQPEKRPCARDDLAHATDTGRQALRDVDGCLGLFSSCASSDRGLFLEELERTLGYPSGLAPTRLPKLALA
jgi:hypothetical protein